MIVRIILGNMRILSLWAVCFVFGGRALAAMDPAQMSIGPILVALEGVASVSVRSADGKLRDVREGDPLELGDSFQTGDNGSARIVFEQGTQVLVAPKTSIGVGEESVAGIAGGLEVPSVELTQGEARFLVPPSSKTTLKFLVRTKSAALGVHGTDFVVSATENSTGLHTLSSVVDIAADASLLGKGQSVGVAHAETIEVTRGKPIAAPEHYEMTPFLKDFHERNPKLEDFWKSSVSDAKTRRIVRMFREARARKLDLLNASRPKAPPSPSLSLPPPPQ